MEYFTLNNGVQMPIIGFGTWDVRREQGKRSILEAFETGYRLIDTAQVALRFLVQNGIAVIPKSVHRERMKENLAIFDFRLSQEDMKQLILQLRNRPILCGPAAIQRAVIGKGVFLHHPDQ